MPDITEKQQKILSVVLEYGIRELRREITQWDWGSLTEQGVEAFQTKYGIVTYGTPGTTGYGAVGPRTRGELNAL